MSNTPYNARQHRPNKLIQRYLVVACINRLAPDQTAVVIDNEKYDVFEAIVKSRSGARKKQWCKVYCVNFVPESDQNRIIVIHPETRKNVHPYPAEFSALIADEDIGLKNVGLVWYDGCVSMCRNNGAKYTTGPNIDLPYMLNNNLMSDSFDLFLNLSTRKVNDAGTTAFDRVMRPVANKLNYDYDRTFTSYNDTGLTMKFIYARFCSGEDVQKRAFLVLPGGHDYPNVAEKYVDISRMANVSINTLPIYLDDGTEDSFAQPGSRRRYK